MTTKRTEGPRRTPTDDEIPALLEAVAATGGNIAAFAREHGLAAWKLYEAQRVAAVRGPRRGRRRKADADFVPVRIVDHEPPASCAPLELVLGSGRRLLIPPGFDETTLRRALGVLSSC